ncbi:MAG: YjbQ family protein [bacterium]|nr:MAG: YjbQ family protein [bacterium]
MSATDSAFICHSTFFSVRTRGELDIVDVSEEVFARVERSGVEDGFAHLFVAGSTAALTTVEFESGALSDLRAAIERIAPEGIHYDHDARWGDGNGRSHVRAAVLGPSLTVPVRDGGPVLGTWQQVILIELDLRARDRVIYLTVTGGKQQRAGKSGS